MRVRSSASFPVDGVIVFGGGFVNEASLTGESNPVEKFVGDPVFSSTLSESGVLKIRATNTGKDSTIARMAKLIEEATLKKSKAQRLADRFSPIGRLLRRGFCPVVGERKF